MLPLKPRRRLVTFRVTDEEYEELCRMCLAAGSRSISEFARTALREMMLPARQWRQSDLAKRIDDLQALMEELKANFAHHTET